MSARLAAFMPDLPPAMAPDDAAVLPAPRSLDQLAAAVRRELDLVQYPSKSWVLPKRAPDGTMARDVVIVGAGQSGLAAAFGLLRQRVPNIVVLDENPRGQEGPWATYGRMRSLATDKHVGGMDLGLPSLSVRAWFEAQHGADEWQAITRLTRPQWHAYLRWYRDVLDLPVRNHCRLIGFRPHADDLLAVEIETPHARETIWTRKLVLATGIEGNGAHNVPAFVAALPADRWRHCFDPIDFSALAGKRVGVLGGADSAFDNAATAAEHGATVHLWHRRKQLNPMNPLVWGRFAGFVAHYADLDLATRWRFTHQIHNFTGPPPAETHARAMALANLTVHAGATWTGATVAGDAVDVAATDGPMTLDYLILATGSVIDIAQRRELAPHAPHIALWRDVYTPPPEEANENLACAPFLGPHFEFQEKLPGGAPWLAGVFNFARGAQLSMGAAAIGLSGIKLGVPRLVHGISRQLFCEDQALYLDGFKLWQASAGDVGT
jgi:cation diffusion facilitator CzcD-associated flavoprotein CzcO